MKNACKYLGIIAFIVVIGFAFVSCGGLGNDDGTSTGDAPATSASLTIAGLDDYNGNYIFAQGDSVIAGEAFIAGEGFVISPMKYFGTRISGGKATLKVWEVIYENEEDETPEMKSYSGDAQNVVFRTTIFSQSSLSESNADTIVAEGQTYPVDFNNGSGSTSYLPPVIVDLGNGITGEIIAFFVDEEESIIEIDLNGKDGNSVSSNDIDHLQDFEITIDNNPIIIDRLYLGDDTILFHISETINIGDAIQIQILYSADNSSVIEVAPEGEDITLASFDTGVKTVVAEEW
jgi:hypothetical protein